MTEFEPYPYGDDFKSVNKLMEIVKKRQEQNLQVYGHAVIFISHEGNLPDRIGARVGLDGSITVGTHCEWI